MKVAYRPLIVVEAPDAEAAREEILKFLTGAQLSGRIFYFQVPPHPDIRGGGGEGWADMMSEKSLQEPEQDD